MKNTYKVLNFLTAVILVISLTNSLQAQYNSQTKQKIELSATGTYLFGGIWPVNNGELNIVNNYGFQGDLSYKLTKGMSAGISYTYVPTELRFRDFFDNGNETKLFDMDIHYIFLNFVFEKENRNATPYCLAGFGGTIFAPKDNSIGSEFRFASSLGGGIKINPSKSVGIRIQARLLLPITGVSTGVFAGSGGAGYGVGATSAIIQADLSAGITFRF